MERLTYFGVDELRELLEREEDERERLPELDAYFFEELDEDFFLLEWE